MASYSGFGIRPYWQGSPLHVFLNFPDMVAGMGGLIGQMQQISEAAFSEPFTGITTDGSVVPGLFGIEQSGVSNRTIVSAANEYLATLADGLRTRATAPVAGDGWRKWWNAFATWTPPGIRFEDMTAAQREAALTVVRATLSDAGFETARGAMKLNETLAELVGAHDELGEWKYWFTIYGTPSRDEPWGWQIHGHHLVVSCFVLKDQIVLTPSFIGAEPNAAETGKHAGTQILLAEEQAGLELINALTAQHQEQAILFRSILSNDLPPDRKHPADGRHKAGAFADNLVLPYEGVCAGSLSVSEQHAVLHTAALYAGLMRQDHAAAKMRDIEKHLGETHVAWIGGTNPGDAFYYKIHSPVLLIEFDMHPGVFLANDEPERFHIHTVVRTPNGNDYGRDLLRQHYAGVPHR